MSLEADIIPPVTQPATTPLTVEQVRAFRELSNMGYPMNLDPVRWVMLLEAAEQWLACDASKDDGGFPSQIGGLRTSVFYDKMQLELGISRDDFKRAFIAVMQRAGNGNGDRAKA